ncbi:MAG: hypothetical protein JRJ38_18225 [Deltaproteobacteria bacterium]|nr:hypothetical protein [Deltaproteobacteria bacterium]
MGCYSTQWAGGQEESKRCMADTGIRKAIILNNLEQEPHEAHQKEGSGDHPFPIRFFTIGRDHPSYRDWHISSCGMFFCRRETVVFKAGAE